jgi:hypothetical protein
MSYDIPKIAFIPGVKMPETSERMCLVGIDFQNGNVSVCH